MTGVDVVIVALLVTASFIKGALGFADALFAMPLLVLLMPVSTAAPLMAIAALWTSVIILSREWKDVDIRPAALLIASSMVGIPSGIWLLNHVDQRIVKSVLGATLIVFSVWSIRRPGSIQLQTDRLAPVFGFTAGVLSGAFSTGGPPMMIYASLRRWSPQKFRSTMQAYSLVGSGWVITAHSLAGNVTAHTLNLLLVAAPLIFIGTLTGQRMTKYLATERFIQLVYIVLLLMGAGLVASGLF